MAQQIINAGTTANDGTGDPLRTGINKLNSNFTELYSFALFNSQVTATLATSQNNYSPGGWGPTIKALIVGAASGGSAITGLSSSGFTNGTSILIVNTSSTDSITFPHLSGSSSVGNQFSNPSGSTVAISPLGSSLFVLITSIGWIPV